MNKLSSQIDAIEKTLQFMWGAKRAGDETAVKAASEALARRVAALTIEAASAVESEDEGEQGQQKEAGEMPDFIKEKVEEKDDKDEGEKKEASTKTASYDNLDENAKIAEEILAAVNDADAGIDEAVAAGKPVNAALAKSDLFKVASRLANVLQDVNMAEPWVRDELVELQARSATIASYFPRTAASKDWKESGGDMWQSRAKYANGEAHLWTIRKKGDKFEASVEITKGPTKQTRHKAKKKFDSLDAAQSFGDRFIQKANGNDMLEKALDKDFE